MAWPVRYVVEPKFLLSRTSKAADHFSGNEVSVTHAGRLCALNSWFPISGWPIPSWQMRASGEWTSICVMFFVCYLLKCTKNQCVLYINLRSKTKVLKIIILTIYNQQSKKKNNWNLDMRSNKMHNNGKQFNYTRKIYNSSMLDDYQYLLTHKAISLYEK